MAAGKNLVPGSAQMLLLRLLAERDTFETVHTVEHLAHQALPIFPQTLETYNAFVHYLKD